jgi:hypothetical protein
MSVVIEQNRAYARPVSEAGAIGRETTISRTEWCLRIGAAACFIGHGAFGVITKEAWVAYFAIAGIGRDFAFTLMPIIGAVDIAAGILVLISPRPIVLWYMVIWGVWTASLRPLAGESVFETLERAGNYGVPLALALFYANALDWRRPLGTLRRVAMIDRANAGRVLMWTTATLLFAHGALQAMVGKPMFTAMYAAIGVPASVVSIIGVGEMLAALLVVIAPVPAMLLLIAAWKLATEALFPISGAPVWEFIERGGSYAAPIALVFLSGQSLFTRITFSRSSE